MSINRNLGGFGGTANISGYITTSQLTSILGAAGVIYENTQTISSNYTMTTNKNGMSVGPITINTGVTVTLPTGSRWVIL
jgi:hypothetical protein